MTTTTACNRDCGAPIDLTAEHVTVVRNVEQWDEHGNECTVTQSTEIAAYHPACAPTPDDLLDGLIDHGHTHAGSRT